MDIISKTQEMVPACKKWLMEIHGDCMPATVANALGEDGKEDSEKQLVYTRQSTMYLKQQSQIH